MMAQVRILIVEDERIVARDLEDGLKALGYAVSGVASSGEDGVLQAAKTRPDLVLMDIRLRGEVDGVEAAGQIRTQFDIPVVYLTAYADDETFGRAKVTAPFGYILKPFEARELRITIEMALHQHELEKRLRESEARYRVISEQDATERKQAEQELRQYRDHLEELVDQHTAELLEANERLEREMAERVRVMEMEVRQRNEQLVALNAISTAAVSSLEPDTVLHQILASTCHMLGADGGSILLRQPNTGAFFFAVVVAGDADALRGRRLKPGQGITGWVAQHGQAVCVNDVHQDERWYDGVDQITGFRTRSVLCTPLVYREEVTGVIEIVSQRVGEFEDQDLILLESVASIAAVALENARLYTTTRARAEELALLNEIGLALTATLDRATVTRAALHQIQRLFQAAGVVLLELDRQTGELCVVRTVFGVQELEVSLRLAPGEGIAGWVLANRQPVLVKDVQNDPRWSARFDPLVSQYLGDQACTLMAVPLSGQDHDIGVVKVFDREPSLYTLDELRTLQAIASTLAVALENARLYDELKAALDARKRAQAQLIQAEKVAALGRLLASLAHEINNPLQALRSSLSLLMNHEPPEEKRRIYLDLAHREVERLVGIVERVLGFYRPSKEGPEPVDIDGALDETLLLVHKQLEHGRVTVHRRRPVELPLVQAVAGQLKQVFLNIILNALQAMPKGGELTVESGWDDPAGEVYVVFADTGVGIPDDEMDLLFEPFFTTRPEGTGRGLTVSYSIVEQHGGRIEVESHVDVGSTFTVVLPIEAPGLASGVANENEEETNSAEVG
jgi:signal transduction histidine kinase/DNA-binding response OmpR family regulator